MAIILDGKKLSKKIAEKLKAHQNLLSFQIIPSLAIIQIGENPASSIYIRNKQKKIQKLGWKNQCLILSENISKESLLQHIVDLNNNSLVHGIILQLPLPEHLKKFQEEIIFLIHPSKDVDGLHPLNQGMLLKDSREFFFMPSTPLGCLLLLKFYGISVEGKKVLMIGRSSLVGKPLGLLLLREGGTVTFAHSRTIDLEHLVRDAQIVCVATGVSGVIVGKWLSKDTVLVDVGIHRKIEGASREFSHKDSGIIFGDVYLEDKVRSNLHAYTPVPGGVGPMTVISLMYNVLKAACLLHDVPFLSVEMMSREWGTE